MKLKDYVMFQRNELNSILKKKLINYGVHCSIKLLNSERFLINLGFNVENEEISMHLIVSVSYMENEKNELVKNISVIIEQIILKNYNCREIETNDKYDSKYINYCNNNEICLDKVWVDCNIVYDKKEYDKEF